MFALQRKLREAQSTVWELIFSLTDGKIGDIVEVFWSEGSPAQVSASPSLKFAFLRHPPPTTTPHQLFSSIPTNPSTVCFNSEESILFISSLMEIDGIEQFIARIGHEERTLIQKLAINHDKFVAMEDKTVLTSFTALKELILVSEIPTGDSLPPLGPTATPPQSVVFYPVVSTATRSEVPWNANDLRFQTESQLEEIRRQDGAWPAGFVSVNVVIIKRDGELMETDLDSDMHKDFRARKKEEADRDAKAAAEAEEKKADGKYIDDNSGDADSDGGVGTLGLDTLAVQRSFDPESWEANTTDDIEVRPEIQEAIDEMERKRAEREKDEEIEKELQQSDNATEDDVWF